jgi:hypothetical protein
VIHGIIISGIDRNGAAGLITGLDIRALFGVLQNFFDLSQGHFFAPEVNIENSFDGLQDVVPVIKQIKILVKM